MKAKLSVLFLILLATAAISFGQKRASTAEAQWEVLEVRDLTYMRAGDIELRDYRYVTAGVEIVGPPSIEWLQTAGWEFVAIRSDEGGRYLYFKRRYNRKRTESEIAWVNSAVVNAKPPTRPAKLLNDLDEAERLARPAENGRVAVAKLRDSIEKISGLTLRIADIRSDVTDAGRRTTDAVIVIDGTRELLKNGKDYRSSEANEFFRKSVTKIADDLGLTLAGGNRIDGNAVMISRAWKPQSIERDYYNIFENMLWFRVVIRINGAEIVVAKGEFVVRPKTSKP